jgi:hypothetical protein
LGRLDFNKIHGVWITEPGGSGQLRCADAL